MRPLRLLLIPALAGLLCACAASPPPAPALPAPPAGSCSLPAASSDDEDAIRAVLRAEGELVVSQQIDQLMALWAEDSRVVNAKNTPHDQSDDQLWMGKDAVRHRYVRIVFPGAPKAAAPADLIFAISGESAVVTATTHIGSEVSPAGDRWQLVRQGGCWVIERLVYNLEAGNGQ